MSKYAKFKALLEGFLYDNVNKSHIATLFDEGAKTTIFSASPPRVVLDFLSQAVTQHGVKLTIT